MKQFKRFFLLYLSALSSFVAQGQFVGQKDFDAYSTILAEGKIPLDFTVSSSLKVKEGMQNDNESLSQREQRIFLEGIHYGIDDLLQSGLVIYGDEISKYVNDVADNLLAKDKKLRGQLRFYTIKSNVTNAFSTDQGIIFVTTGLISQLVNEAQLAFILGHEIAHFTQKHVIETFEYQSRNKGINTQITQLATYSKDKEFEADLLGIELYQKAGYSKNDILKVFDVMMYSYLPIDEISIGKDYFESDLCFLPNSVFTDHKYPIKADEAYDDKKSTHPNIKSRREKAKEKIESFQNWNTSTVLLQDNRFEYVRNLCRFESVRLDMINHEFAKALYTIFILERNFPNSRFLNQMKGLAWFNIASYKQDGKLDQVVPSKSEWEGEAASLYYFLRNLRSKELQIMAMRTVEDCRKKDPENEQLKMIWQKTVKVLHKTEGLSLENLKSQTFIAYTDSLAKISKPKNSEDTLKKEVTESTKYDRINSNKIKESKAESNDTSMYYLFNLSDLVKDQNFINELKSIELKVAQEKALNDSIEALSDREYRRYKKAAVATNDLSKYILVDPSAVSYTQRKVNFTKSERLKKIYLEAFDKASKKLDFNLITIDRNDLKDQGTEGFNDKGLLTSLLIQITNSSTDKVLVDYDLIKQLSAKYGTTKLVFSIVEHLYFPEFSGNIFYSILFPPLFPYFFAVPFIQGNNTEINILVLDIEKGEISAVGQYYFEEPSTQLVLQAHLYDILKNL